MTKLLSPSPVAQQYGLMLIRVVIALFLLIHGKEVFDTAKMQEYVKWDAFKSASFMPYFGKAAEFIAGVLLLAGLFTRPACLIVIATFAYIVFFVGKGKFWMEDQHPFMFVLFGILFLFTGPGAFSLDNFFSNSKKYNRQ